MRRLSFLVLSCSCLVTTAFTQKSYWDVEYGIGLITFKDREKANAIVYAEPSLSSDTLVIVEGWNLNFVKEGITYHSKGLMVEFSYEGNGFPILKYNSDSNWVQITVDCNDTSATSLGWFFLKQGNLRIVNWTEMLPRMGLFFVKDEYIRFFLKLDSKSEVKIDLTKHRSPEIMSFSYIMRPINVKGRWLYVELTTPYSPCGSYGKVEPSRKFWIEYLDERYRPKVFYYTRGC